MSARDKTLSELRKAQGTWWKRGWKECKSLKMGKGAGKEQDVGMGSMNSQQLGTDTGPTEVRPS